MRNDKVITVSIIKSPWARVENGSALMSLNGGRPEIVRIKPEQRQGLEIDRDQEAEHRLLRKQWECC